MPSSYYGFGNLPFQIDYGSQAVSDYMNSWPNAWSAWLQPYLAQFGGTPFAGLLEGSRGRLENRFEADNARRLAEGGDLFSQMRPDEWLKTFDPMAYYLSLSPGERGEGRPQNPFIRWLNF